MLVNISIFASMKNHTAVLSLLQRGSKLHKNYMTINNALYLIASLAISECSIKRVSIPILDTTILYVQLYHVRPTVSILLASMCKLVCSEVPANSNLVAIE